MLRICHDTQTSQVKRLALFNVMWPLDYILQFLKKLKLETKLGPETVHKYSNQNKSRRNIKRAVIPKKNGF